jgi:hypothetical protein
VWLAAVLEVTLAVQLVPELQLCSTLPVSSTMSMYHCVGPTSMLVVALSVTFVFTATLVALALKPVRQVPSPAQVLVAVLVAVGATGVLVAVAGTGVLVAVAATSVLVAVGRIGVLVAVATLVEVLVGVAVACVVPTIA